MTIPYSVYTVKINAFQTRGAVIAPVLICTNVIFEPQSKITVTHEKDCQGLLLNAPLLRRVGWCWIQSAHRLS